MSNSDEISTVNKDSTAPGTPEGTPDSQSSISANDRVAVNSACIACRSKHLKCDGLRLCSRCASQGLQCVYLKSRRGYRGSSARGRGHGQSSLQRPDQSSYSAASPSNVNQRSLSISASTSAALHSAAYGAVFQPSERHLDKNSDPISSDGSQDHQRCFDAFYNFFHSSHPFLLPRKQMLQFLQASPINHLLTAISLVGSRYIPGTSRNNHIADLEMILLAPPGKDASMVQTMLLYAIALDSSGEQIKAIELLVKAQRLALEIGLNTREYAIVHGRGSSIYEESLRRTWYELYVVCVLAAGFHSRRPFHVQDSKFLVPLPCDEKDYELGSIPPPHTLEEFEEDSFTEDDIDWSSYAYRISAVRNLDRIIQTTPLIFHDDPAIDRQEAYLTNWKLHLPASKQEYYDEAGTFDEMIFQAHMITEVSYMLLHRHHSRREVVAVQTITSCTPNEQVEVAHMTDSLHTIKTAKAAANISRLVGLPTPLIQHTHFFVCALTLSSIAHLSTWSALPVMTFEQELKEQIRMNAGALKAVAEVWPSARLGFSQVTKAAQIIYANRKDAAGDVFWRDFMQDDFMTGLIEETLSVDDPLAERLLHEDGSLP